MNAREPSWINTLLIVAIISALAFVFTAAYRGWREDRALHAGGEKHSGMIADITVNLSGIAQQEHCLTCHPRGRAVQSQPVRPHPNISPHSMTDLGCTGCHLGEGMARDKVISHGVPGMEARKVLSGKDLQASCYRCHELKPLTGAEKARDGFLLFAANACGTCHNVDGLTGGRYGPDLSEVGSYLGLKQIRTAIDDPRAEPENSIMPKFSLSPEQIRDLSYFLKSRVKEPLHETPMVRLARLKKEAQVPKKTLSGIDLLKEKKCLACHKYGEEDGQIGPDLSYIGYMRNRNYIVNFLHAPGKEIPGATMPWIKLSPPEEEGTIGFLQRRDHGAHLRGMNSKHLYMQLCQRCHAAQGDGLGTIQPNLSNFPRAFWKNAEFLRRIPDERIVRSIGKGIPGTSMPPYGELLRPEDIHSVIDLLFRQFVRIGRHDKKGDWTVPPRPAKSMNVQQTGKIFRRLCASCHGVEGNGKGPEYLKHLPRPRNLNNRPYFQAVGDDRIARAVLYGIPGTSMPSFREKLSGEAVWSLVDKIRGLSGTDGKAGRAN